MSTVAHSQKPLGSVPIIFGGTEGKTISVPKYLQTIQKGIKTGQTKIKHSTTKKVKNAEVIINMRNSAAGLTLSL